MKENTVSRADVAARVAARSLAKREADYAGEVRRLLDAALALIGAQGRGARVRVADIVTAAGLSNDAFYRHFPSKDALVVALVEDGTERLASYVAHQMAKEPTPEGRVRRWVDGVLSQTDEVNAATTLAVLQNSAGLPVGRRDASTSLATLLHEPLAALGNDEPELDARLVAHAALGVVSDCLWAERRPTSTEVERITELCLHAGRR